MSEPDYLETQHGRRVAYHRVTGAGPTIVFCHGLRSDMAGTKAVHLAAWARSKGRDYLRFDCSGHGKSSGRFEDGCIGDWFEDAVSVVSDLIEGPVILVGSSMGGWLSLLLARQMPERIAGMVTIAAAPDFTVNGIEAALTDAQIAEIVASGRLEMPSEYGEPMVITKRLLDDGRNWQVMREPLPLPFPVRMLHGMNDIDVPPSVGLQLLEHVAGDDISLTLVKGADHRFSEPENLALIEAAIDDVVAATGTARNQEV